MIEGLVKFLIIHKITAFQIKQIDICEKIYTSLQLLCKFDFFDHYLANA